MLNFFLVTVVYLPLSVLVATVTQGGGWQAFDAATEALLMLAELMAAPVAVLFCLAALWSLLRPGPLARRRLTDIALASVSCLFLQVGFSVFKTTIPGIVPFYADGALADVDAWLHGGTDPWVLAHALGRGLPVVWVERIYVLGWSFLAVLFPLALAAVETDSGRRATFLKLYLGTWFVLGNLAALAGSSVGPVFYDQFLGGARFAGLAGALDTSGIASSQVGAIQGYLWNNFVRGLQEPSAAISAFPSLHVAIATIVALYLSERSRWLAPLGIAFVGAILFLSVFTGYHYAIDGYSSIAAVVAGRWALRGGQAARPWGFSQIRAHLPALILRSGFVALRLPHSNR